MKMPRRIGRNGPTQVVRETEVERVSPRGREPNQLDRAGMLQKLFGHPPEKGYQMAVEVHTRGRVIVDTTSKERAELKRDQIHAFGADPLIVRCQGSMSATIEAAE